MPHAVLLTRIRTDDEMDRRRKQRRDSGRQVREVGHAHHQSNQMYGGGHDQFTRIDTRSTNGSSSKNSLVNSMQSGQSTQSSGQENAWSLTARIRSRGDAGPDPEYQGSCCRYLHYSIAAGGVLLVLFVILLISIETYRSVSKAGELNGTQNLGGAVT